MNKIFLGVFTIAIGLTSCNKFLNLQPKESIGQETALGDKQGIQRALTGAYNNVHSTNYYGFEWSNAIWLSDDNVTAVGSGTTDMQFDNHTVDAASNTLGIVWNAMYKSISSANNVIQATQTVDISQDDKNNLSGQALFIRALVYFDLARTFGKVPIVLKPTSGFDSSVFVKKSSVEQVYAQVLQDLNDAEAKLPETLNRNIATKKAAQALKARYYLYQKDWANAEQYANTVIADNAEYSLVKPFENLITIKNNTESIFELAYNPTDGNPLSGAFYPTDMAGSYRIGPTADLVNILSNVAKAGDRKTMLAYEGTTPYGNRYRNVGVSRNDDDYAVLRLAEMYLIRAEARAHQPGKVATGLSDLNAVRQRSNLIAATAADSDALLQLVEDERRIEFAFEPFRWFDLIRTGRVGAVLGITDSQKLVFPVPTAEVVANPNLGK